MSDDSVAEPLAAADWALLEERADAFHAAREAGPVKDWEPYLLDLKPDLRSAVLVELAVIDLGQCWKSNESARAEDYLSKFREYDPPARIPTKLILEEIKHRRGRGERLDPDRFRERFPEQYMHLQGELGKAPSASAPLPKPKAMQSVGTAETVSFTQRYELIRQLGKGAFGEVWLARKQPTGIEVAVKIVTQPADHDTAKREAASLELIKNLRHPFLIATLDYWVQSDKLHIAMELADGTLRGRMKACQQDGQPGVPRDELIGYFAQTAAALDYLHRHNITHRDVKADNILLMGGFAKVADFGLARQQQAVMTSMSFAGTPAYMAPEIWGGKGGPASDQYSLAFAFIELRQGFPPIAPGPFADVMFAHMEGKYEFGDAVSGEERGVLCRALARNPVDRFPTCAAFVDELALVCGVSVRRPGGPGSGVTRPILPPGGGPGSGGGTTLTPPKVGPKPPGTKPQPPLRKMPPVPPPAVQLRPPVRPSVSRVKLIAAIAAVLTFVGLAGGLVAMVMLGPDTTPTTEATSPGIGPGPQPPPPVPPNNGNPNPPPPAQPWLPPRATAAVTAKVVPHTKHPGGVYDRIAYATPGGPAEFVLFAGNGGSVRPFYLQTTKLTAGQFTGAIGPGSALPAVDMTLAAAVARAKALFGGRLPTPEQWDHAAGYSPGRTGPIGKLGSVPMVEVAAPADVTTSLDETPAGVRDMAGNGREWTRKRLRTDIPADEGSPPMPDELIVLRGRNFTLRSPLTFDIIEYEQKTPQTQFAGKGSRYTGFRVVVEIP